MRSGIQLGTVTPTSCSFRLQKITGKYGIPYTEAGQRYEGRCVWWEDKPLSEPSHGTDTRGDGRSCFTLASRRKHFAGGAPEQIF